LCNSHDDEQKRLPLPSSPSLPRVSRSSRAVPLAWPGRPFRGAMAAPAPPGRLDEPALSRDLPRLRPRQNLDSPDGVAHDEPRSYVALESLQLNTWALAGNWTIEERASVLSEAGGRIAFRFHARDVHLVLRSRAGTAVPFRVLVTAKRPAQPRAGRRRGGPGNAGPATALSAGARARVDHGPHVRDRIPRCGRRGVRLHLRLATGSAFSGAGARVGPRRGGSRHAPR
jgi:Thioredoxin like C-terminal domain